MNKKKKIKIGWIGSGFVGQNAHLHSFSTLDNVQIDGLAELREDLREKVKLKYNIKNSFHNHHELIEEGNYDAIVAIVRRHHTATIAKDVLSSGNNLFTEKPMASTYSQCKELTSIASKKNLLYVIGNMRRHDSAVMYAKEYFDKIQINKNLGEMISFRLYCYAGGDYCNIDGDIKSKYTAPTNILKPLAPNWVKKNKIYEFEKFLTFFVHDINLINYFFEGMPKIQKVIYNKNGGNIQFEYPKFFGTFDFAYIKQDRWIEGLEILFEKGSIKVELEPAFLRNSPSKVTIYSENKARGNFLPKIDFNWSFKNQAKDFINCLVNNIDSKSSGSKSLKDYKIIERILELSL